MRKKESRKCNEIRIYVEGDPCLRQPFGEFFKEEREAARKQRIKWTIVLRGARKFAYSAFVNALKDHPKALNILLVDSECSVVANSPWQHLRERIGDSWTRPKLASDDHCHLMAQSMESWFLADREILRSYFGNGFRENALPSIGPDGVEAIDKDKLLKALNTAAKGTKKEAYRKTIDAPKLLAKLNPDTVRNAAPHCDRLFKIIEKTIQDQS